MSIPVELTSLAGALARYRFAYLMTGSAEGAPHAVAVQAALQGGELVVDGVGRRTHANALERPAVALVWPPADEGGYSLIVDGRARAAGGQLRIQPLRAVLHRPAPPRAPAGEGCGSDCVELRIPSAE